MRNLKRALSLALALVMVMSMMVVGAGAVSIDDFTDADEIVNTEAVTTMVSLGVIDGNDDGSYNPSGIVKRGEMAKLIAVMLNGGSDPTLGETPVVFADTAGHWAQNYISYVANLHIIDGRGDGTFGPNDDVTGSEAAKMLLTALGYRSDLEGFTGANWAINVQAMANQVELFEGLTINPDEGLSRDNTAQMLYNAVQADMVEYRNLEGSYDGIVYPQPINGVNNDSTVLYERFQVRKVEGVVQATSLIALSGQPTVEGRTRLTDIEYNGERWGETNSSGQFTPTPVTYPVAIDSDLLGQRVVIYVKGLNDLAPNASGMEVIGTPIVSDDNTVVTTTSRLKDDAAVRDALKGSGIAVEFETRSGVEVSTATGLTITWDDTSATKNAACDGITTTLTEYPGVEQTFIDNNDDGSVDVIIRRNPGLAKVNTYNTTSEKINLSGLGTIDFVDVLNPDDVAQGDYVLVYDYDGTYVLEQAETVSGTVSAYRNNADNDLLSKITVEEADYGWGAGENLAPDLWDVADYSGRALDDLVDGTYTIYLDANGNMLGLVEDEAALGSYAVITGINATGSRGFRSVDVKLILSDGTTGTYSLNLLSTANNWDERGTGVNTGTNAQKEEAMWEALADLNGDGNYDMVDTLVSYSLDGSNVTLGRPDYSTQNYSEATTNTDLELRNSKARYDFGGTTVVADDRTVFFIRDVNDDYSVTTGLSNLRADRLENTTATVIYYTAPGSSVNNARAIFAQVTDEYVSNSNYAYISGDFDRTVEDSSYVYTYPVVSEAGEPGELKTRTDSEWIQKNTVLEYQVNGSYVAFDEDEQVVNKVVVTSVRPGAVSVADAEDGTSNPDSFPTGGSTVWNVEDLGNIFETNFQTGDLVSLVLDRDGNVQTAYVYDRQDGEYATAADMTFKMGVAALDDTDLNDAGQYEVYGVAANSALTLPVVLDNDDQTVTVTAKVVGGTGTGELDAAMSNGFKVNKDTDTNARTATIYTVGDPASENGIEILVTVKVEQDGYATRTVTYTIILWSGTATMTAPAVQLKESGSAVITSGKDTNLTEGADASNTAAVTVTNGADQAWFSITPDGTSAVKSVNLTGPDGAVELDSKYVFSIAKSGTYTLSVVISNEGQPDCTFVYNLNITLTAEDTAPLPEVDGTAIRDQLNPDGTGTAIITLPETTKPDQTASLVDGTIGGSLLVDYDSLTGSKATGLRIMIPVADNQAAASVTDGLAIRQTNAALRDGQFTADIDAEGRKDKHYTKSADNDYVWENGQRYIALWVVVSEQSLENGITIEVDFGTANTFATGASADLTIHVDLSRVSFQ